MSYITILFCFSCLTLIILSSPLILFLGGLKIIFWGIIFSFLTLIIGLFISFIFFWLIILWLSKILTKTLIGKLVLTYWGLVFFFLILILFFGHKLN